VQYTHTFTHSLTHSLAYSNAELPFIVYNVPAVEATRKRWSDVRYLYNKLGNRKYRTEVSENNHFMYWSSRNRNSKGSNRNKGGRVSSSGKDWSPPTAIERMHFSEWLWRAARADDHTR